MKRKSLVGQVALVLLSVQILMFGSFGGSNLPTATGHNLQLFLTTAAQELLPFLPQTWQQGLVDQFPSLTQPVAPIRYSPYVPLAPLAVGLGYVLGVPLGFISVAVFFILGLVGPNLGIFPLAAGGGLEYFRQPTFGYLIGMIFGSWFAGRITLSPSSSLRQILAVGGGLFLIHCFGLLYLVGSCLAVLLFEGDAAYFKWQPWLFENIRNLSWYSLPWDAAFSLAAIGLGAPLRWLVSTLTTPDATCRQRPSSVRELEPASP